MSASHFMFFFRQATGQSFLSFLNHFRIARAQAELISTEQTVCEISQNVGFFDQSHFSLVFRKLVGVAPLAYRRRFSNTERLKNSGQTAGYPIYQFSADEGVADRRLSVDQGRRVLNSK